MFYTKKRISIIVEKAFKDRVIKLIEDAGASGYTIYTGIYGKGHHGVKEAHGGLDEFTGNVEIVTITSEKVAEQILIRLQKLMEKNIVLIVHVIDTLVIRDNQFS